MCDERLDGVDTLSWFNWCSRFDNGSVEYIEDGMGMIRRNQIQRQGTSSLEQISEIHISSFT